MKQEICNIPCKISYVIRRCDMFQETSDMFQEACGMLQRTCDHM